MADGNPSRRRSIRILHLSDLLARTQTGRPEDDRLADLFRGAFPEEAFDYILISGNLTADAQPESFQVAGRVVDQLARRFLRYADHRRRIVIVPGRCDVEQETGRRYDDGAFARFYDDFYAHEISGGLIDPFFRGRWTFRELKDLTVLGLSYWNGAEDHRGAVAPLGLRRFLCAVRRAKERVRRLDLPYREATPTLLVSHECPALVWEIQKQLRSPELRKAIESHLRLTIHCFGASDATCFSFEPFLYGHIGVSTGPRPAGERWPLRLNALEFEYRDYDGEDEPPPSLRLTVSERLDRSCDWTSATVVQGDLDQKLKEWFPDLPRLGLEEPYGRLLAEIRERLPTARKMLIKGLPGSGIREFLHHALSSSIRLDGESTPVLRTSWSGYKDMRPALLDLRQRLRKAQRQAAKGRGGPGQVLLACEDLAFSLPQNRKEADQVALIRDELRMFAAERVSILYFVETAARIPRDLEKEFDHGILLETFSTEGLQRFVSRYAFRAPIRFRHVRDLTGGYAGLAKSLMERAREEFQQWPGDSPLSEPSINDLIEKSLRGREDAPLRFLVSSIEEQPGVGLVRKYVHALVRSRTGDSLWDHDFAAGVLTFDLEGLLAYCRARNGPSIGLRETLMTGLEILVKLRLLTKMPSSDLYALSALAPFLDLQPSRDLFIAYPGPWGGLATQIDAEIRDELAARRLKLRTVLFTQREIGSLAPEILEALRSTRYLVVVFEDGKLREGWQTSEVEHWLDRWRDGIGSEAGAVTVAVDAFARPPLPLPSECPVLHYRGDARELSREIVDHVEAIEQKRWTLPRGGRAGDRAAAGEA